MATAKPLKNSYWIIPGRFLAGEYPRTLNEKESQQRLCSMIEAGITCFVDLTAQADGLKPYHGILRNSFSGKVVYHNAAIQDVSVPDRTEQMVQILDLIDEELCRGGTVYVHCWGGVGRTGTVVGCWLMRHFSANNGKICWGLKQDESVTHGLCLIPDERGLLELWRDCPKSMVRPSSPETPEQSAYVENWFEADRIIISGSTTAVEIIPAHSPDSYQDHFLAMNHKVADAARDGNWDQLFCLLEDHPKLINYSRIGGKSGYTPLHQAAYNQAPADVLRKLLAMGAFRTVRNSSGETAFDVGIKQNAFPENMGLLAPELARMCTWDDIAQLDDMFLKLVQDVIGELWCESDLKLPSLSVIFELECPQLWIPIPGMYGGFHVVLSRSGDSPQCLVKSWSRICEGSEKTHLLMKHGYCQLEG